SMIDQVNEERHEHIITIEDPIEFIHTHKNCIVNQREVKADTENFSKALRYILRQDPDVVLVGELRDLETVASSLTVAETGHLTLATLHTNSCAQTINRVIDIFPSHQQPQIRSQLSFVLQAVISQQLIPHRNGNGRVLAIELMVPNAAIRNLIREDKVHQIYSQMQVGQSRFSMQTMNQSLATLYQSGKISLDDAYSKSNDLMELKQMLGQMV
ncbi:MAG TPA: type IV pili twitching motility protein PilT, partial [Desulfarculaceae bacterium]|nr:type IV pili twitching motility protein PilT [Desulfarculaceae bacterium]